MAYDNRDSIDLGQGDVKKLFRAFFVPTLLGMLFNIAFMLTDGIFVGHGVGPHGLAAVNLIAPIMMLINGAGAMLGIGASVVAAVHMSRGNLKAARINTTQAFITASAVGTVVAVICYSMPDTILRWLGVSAGLHDDVREYYLWFLPTCLLFFVETLGMYIIRLDGSPRYAMYSNMIPSLVNIFFDWFFIFPCDMGLRGAALATDLGGVVGVAMVMHYIFFRAKQLKLYRLKATLTSLRLSLRNVGYMMRVGFSGFVGELAVSVMMLMGNLQFGHYLGDDGVAAYSVICYLFPILYMIYMAVAQSAQPIISFNYGAGSQGRVRHTFRFALLVAIGAGAVLTMLFVFGARWVVSIFLAGGTLPSTLATQGLPLFAVGYIFCGLNVCAIGYLQSVERAATSTLLMSLRGIAFPIAAFLLLPKMIGVPTGLWLAMPVSEALTALITPLLLKPKGKRQTAA